MGRKVYYPVEKTKFPPDASPVEEYNFETLGSDVNDPVWPSEPLDPAVGHTPGHEHGGLRTAHGAIDILTEVTDEVREWVEREDPHGPGRYRRSNVDKPLPLATYPLASDSWRGVTWNVGAAAGGVKIVESRADRFRVVVTNQSAAVIYISHEAGLSTNPPSINTIAIPALGAGVINFREFRTRGELWAFPAVAGTAQTVDVQDEYGTPQ